MSPFLHELLVRVSIITAQKGKMVPTPLAILSLQTLASSVILEGVPRTYCSPAVVNLCPPYFSCVSLSFMYFFKEAETTTYVVT